MKYRAFIIIFCICIWASHAHGDQSLETSWELTYNNQSFTTQFNHRWTDIFSDLDKNSSTVHYRKSFVLSQSAIHESGDFIVFPQYWGQLKITLNGETLTDDFRLAKYGLRNIFSQRIFAVHDVLHEGMNHIEIVARAPSVMGGFRGSGPRLMRRNEIWKPKMFNFFHSDVTYLTAAVTFVTFFLCFGLFFLIKRRNYAYLHIGVYSLLITPYSLISTDLFTIFGEDLHLPFSLQLLCQGIAWPALWVFLRNPYGIYRSDDHKQPFFSNPLFIYSVAFAAAAVIFHLTSEDFTFAYRYFLFPTIVVVGFILPPFIVYYSIKNVDNLWYAFALIAAYLLGTTAIFSDMTGGGVYLSGYTVAIIAVISFAHIIGKFVESAHESFSLNSFVSTALPPSVVVQMSKLVRQGDNESTINSALKGKAVLSNVFIDICGWGVISDQLSTILVEKCRDVVFGFVGAIAEKHGLEYIKSVGDNQHFTGGLLSQQSEEEIADQTGRAILEIIDNVPKLNQTLSSMDLPNIDLKVSATFGLCSFGRKGYPRNYRFDIEGYWLIIAKRIEDSMDGEFYQRYGKNIAMISTGLYRAIEAWDIKARFSHKHRFEEKHGKVLDSAFARSGETVVDLEEFKTKMLNNKKRAA